MALTTVDGGMLSATNAQYTGFKNRIINGIMSVWQRGTTFANPSVSGSFFTADRWGCNRAGDVTGATVSRSSSAPTGFQYSLALQRTAANASTAGLYLFYSSESSYTYDLAGQTVTLSFWAKAGANYSGGAFNTNAYGGTGTDQRVYAYTGSTTLASYGPTLTTTWTQYSTTFTVPSNITEMGLQFSWFPTGTAGADDAVYITGVQLEKGSTATAFDYRPIGTELQLCQRYCYVIGGSTSAPIVTSTMYSSTVIYATVPFPVIPRTSPTGILVTGTYTAFASSNAYNITSISIGAGGTVSCEITGTVAGAVAGQSSFIRVNAAGQIQFTGMEL